MRAAFVPAAQKNNKNITTVTTTANNKQNEERIDNKAPLAPTATTLPTTNPQGKSNVTNSVILDDDDDTKRDPLFKPDERDRMFLFLTEEVETFKSKSPVSASTAAGGTKEKSEKTDKAATAITEICCPICHSSKLINIQIVEAITSPSSSALVTTK